MWGCRTTAIWRVPGLRREELAQPAGATYALSGGLADLLAGKPNDGFALSPVKTR